MSDDLNISVALARVEQMISETNDKFDENPKDKGLKKETLANIEFIDKLLGIGGKEPFSYNGKEKLSFVVYKIRKIVFK